AVVAAGFGAGATGAAEVVTAVADAACACPASASFLAPDAPMAAPSPRARTPTRRWVTTGWRGRDACGASCGAWAQPDPGAGAGYGFAPAEGAGFGNGLLRSGRWDMSAALLGLERAVESS